MQIGIPRETRAGETRVAATPETVKKMMASGQHAIVVETAAGMESSVADAAYCNPADPSCAATSKKCSGSQCSARYSWTR